MRWLWIWTTAVGFTAAGVLLATGVNLHAESRDIMLVAFAMLSLSFYNWGIADHSETMRMIIACAHGVSLFMLIALVAAMGSYAIAGFGHGFTDSIINHVDHRLGVDWRSLYDFERSHMIVAGLACSAYASIAYTPFLLIAGLAFSNNEKHLFRFLEGYALSLSITLAIFFFFPMQSALYYLVGRHPPYMVATGIHQQLVVSLLQQGKLHDLALNDMIGIIGFPSFHAAAAILYIWGAWPLRVYRYPMLVINLAMIAATPVEGAHYVADVIAGLLVGLSSIVLVTTRDRNRRTPKTKVSTDPNLVFQPA